MIQEDFVVELVVQGRTITAPERTLTKHFGYFKKIFNELPPMVNGAQEEYVVLRHNEATKPTLNDPQDDVDPLSKISYETMAILVDFYSGNNLRKILKSFK